MTFKELSERYEFGHYSTRDRIDCGLSCPTCAYCVYASDAYKQEYPDRACFCTRAPKMTVERG